MGRGTAHRAQVFRARQAAVGSTLLHKTGPLVCLCARLCKRGCGGGVRRASPSQKLIFCKKAKTKIPPSHHPQTCGELNQNIGSVQFSFWVTSRPDLCTSHSSLFKHLFFFFSVQYRCFPTCVKKPLIKNHFFVLVTELFFFFKAINSLTIIFSKQCKIFLSKTMILPFATIPN